MEQIIRSVLLGIVIILEFMLYFILVASAAPKLLRNHCAIRTTSDRGLKKYRYPDGRAIVYESHPTVRKYLPTYLLFTKDGYKYLCCRLDESVTRIAYSVVMFNYRNRIVDVIDVEETDIEGRETRPVMLHPDTSYIALVPDTVNRTRLKHETVLRCHLWQLLLYTAVMGGLAFAHMLFIMKTVRVYDAWWLHRGVMDGVSIRALILPAVIIGVLAGLMALRHNRKKGVRWSK